MKYIHSGGSSTPAVIAKGSAAVNVVSCAFQITKRFIIGSSFIGSLLHFVSGSRKRKPDLRVIKPRTRKRVRDEDARFRNDFISRLSDDILHQILSFLPIKDVVRTSVLSTRWRDVWNFFPVVDIDFGSKEMHELRIGFRDLMEREMLNPYSVRIRKFRLRLSYTPTADASDIMLWVDKVMEHKAQELDLALREETIYSLPDQLFSSNSLTKLKLEMDCELTVPNSVCFPRLKILRLSGLIFSSERSTQKLFSSCPVLEELDLDAYNWSRINSIVINIPSLRKLYIGCCTFSDEHLRDSKIMVSAPNLLSFKCETDVPMDLVLLNQSSLEEASIDVLNSRFYHPRACSQRTVKLLHGFQGVKSLTLLSYTLKTLSFEKDLHAILPSFDNLKDLYVVCPSNERCSRALIAILQKTPHLHFLVVHSEDSEPNAAFSKEDGVLNVIPQCFKTSLKRIQFNWLHGNVVEVRRLKYFLENATLLLSMFIKYSGHLSADRIEEIRSELELSHGAASNCEIDFVAC